MQISICIALLAFLFSTVLCTLAKGVSVGDRVCAKKNSWHRRATDKLGQASKIELPGRVTAEKVGAGPVAKWQVCGTNL